jgi:hypothetical protein
MATSQTVDWIALPNGSIGDGAGQMLRLSVFVSPRLRGDTQHATLDAFEFKDWAARVGPDDLSFQIEVENAAPVLAARKGATPDAALWAALFAPDTPVESFTFDDFADRPLVTFSVGTVLSHLKRTYATVAAASIDDLPYTSPPRDDPEAPSLVDFFGDFLESRRGVLEGVDNEKELGQKFEELLQSKRLDAMERRLNPSDPPAPANLVNFGDTNAPGQFAQMAFFHRRLAGKTPVPLPATEEQTRAFYRDRIDFHQMLSALGNYPELMRMLGLVFDLEVPIADIPETPTPQQYLKLRVLPVERPADRSPWTAYVNTAANDRFTFRPAPRDVAPVLNLVEPTYGLVQVDVDGASTKVLNMVSSLERLVSNPDRPINEPDRAGIPALRTGGVSLVRDRNAEKLRDNFLRARGSNQQLETGQLPTLFADDVTRGYRADIYHSETQRWYSLHYRLGTYRALQYPDELPEIPDEGYTQLGVTEQAIGVDQTHDPDSELYVHESLLTWDGWSLSAPRPGKSISRTSKAPTPDDPETQPSRVENRAMTAMGLEVTFHPEPGSLPRLRFGHAYLLRIRSADLAGNSVTVDEATQMTQAVIGGASTLPNAGFLRFARFEPLSPPVLVPRTEYTEGESLELMVIRSNYDASAAEYAAAHPPYSAQNERHVAPPKASLQMVEMLGMLDAAMDTRRRNLPPEEAQAIIASAYEVARREKGSLDDASLSTVRIVTTGGEGEDGQGYAVHTEEQLVVPYLPDPLAEAALIFGLPGGEPMASVEIPYPAPNWYEPVPFRIRLTEGDVFASTWDEATRVLTISLQKAEVVTIRTASKLPADAFQIMGVFNWCEEAVQNNIVSADQFDRIVTAVQENRHWMVTPWRELRLTHAVQQPLDAPHADFLRTEEGTPRSIWRTAAETSAQLECNVDLHMGSTARLDLDATWREPVDDPTAGDPRFGDDMALAAAHVLTIAVPASGREPLLDVREYRLTLTFEPDRNIYFNTSVSVSMQADLRGELLSPALDGQERDRLRRTLELLEQVQPHEFGDTKYRRVTYQFTASSRFRDYFPTEITEDPASISRSTDPATFDVLSSAPPDAPSILYALPTFRWERQGAPGDAERSSIRHGGGLRIYLNRPWFSSGDGELLAVVLPSDITGASIPDPEAPEYPYLTAWGRDPIRGSALFPTPGPQSFTNGSRVDEQFGLRALPESFVSIAAFPVAFDSDRKLWYCDIEIDTEQAYLPFIRLALARYQPHSISGAHLSEVVLADVVQTLPDRTFILTADEAQPGQYAVTVRGPAYQGLYVPGSGEEGELDQTFSDVRVSLEVRNADVADEDLGWDPGPDEPIVLAPDGPPTDEQTSWRGTITVPTMLAEQRVRVVVEEYELLYEEDPDGPQHTYRRGERLVYADIMEL